MTLITHARLLRRLRSADLDDRRSALLEINIDEHFIEAPDLVPFLRDEDAAIRRLAADYLGELRDPRSLPALSAAMEDLSPPVRAAAVQAISALGDFTVVSRLLYQGLYDEDPSVRLVAVKAISPHNDAMSLSFRLRALRDRDLNVRRTAILSLSEVKDSSVTITEVLLQALKDPEWQIVEAALMVIGRRRLPFTRRIHALLDHSRPEIRLAAMEALQRIKQPVRKLNSKRASAEVSAGWFVLGQSPDGERHRKAA